MREARISHGDSKAEKQASEAATRATQHPPPRDRDLTTPAGDGRSALSEAGRAHFEPIVGAPLDRAKIRVDAEAERVTSLAHADAVTYRDNVFIPPSRFAPTSTAGHALLAHELAHVPHAAVAPGTVFRQAKPHYPSKDEQTELEKILGRSTQVVPASPPPTGADADTTPAATKVVDPRKTLSAAEVNTMADSLVAPFEQALTTTFPETGEPDVKLPDAKAALKNTQKALDAINSKFGSYLGTKVTITDDQKLSTDELGAAHQVSVIYGWDPDEPDTFALEVMLNFCPECTKRLVPYTAASQQAVRFALRKRLKANKALWDKVVIAAKHHVGGSHNPGSHKIRLTPYGDDPYANAVHELLHEFTHPAFADVFDQATTEAFTEYFTEEIVGRTTPKQGNTTTKSYDLSKITAMLDAMAGPLSWSSDSAEESLRQAYFKGRLDLIGFRGTEDEEKSVQAAGGAVWDAATAARELAARNAAVQAAQSPHSNLIGIGVYIPLSGPSMLGMRYARVLHAKPPVARTQLYLEGQVLGSITGDTRRVGASVGLEFERQEPSYYYGIGARVLGTGALGGAFDPQVAAQPFLSAGFRIMHYVRVGAEGFALVPGKNVTVGGTVTLGVEL